MKRHLTEGRKNVGVTKGKNEGAWEAVEGRKEVKRVSDPQSAAH